jgi:hypothetical protein
MNPSAESLSEAFFYIKVRIANFINTRGNLFSIYYVFIAVAVFKTGRSQMMLGSNTRHGFHTASMSDKSRGLHSFANSRD